MSKIEYTLESAALKVGLSKKTLDDYLLHLRYGRKFGFNFDKYKDHNMGLLRSFVAEQRKLLRAKLQKTMLSSSLKQEEK